MSKQRPTIEYTYRGLIERSGGFGKYYWTPGYSTTSEEGYVRYPWNTKRECQSEAKAKGFKAVFIIPSAVKGKAGD